MKLRQTIARTLLCLATGLACTAMAQKEQWLEYHTTTEGRGYRWMELGTNPPAGVALPKLEGRAYFVKWTTPLDAAGGRWVCLDQSKKGSLCDRVYADVNGNGRLNDDPPIKATRTDQYSAYFEPIKLVFKGEDGPISYHLLLRFSKYDNSRANLLAQAGGYYAGKVEFNGKKLQVELVDGNVNGAFNDHSSSPWESDRVAFPGGKEGEEERAIGRYLEVEGQYYNFEAARDGAFVKVSKADVVLGKVIVPGTMTKVTLFGENGQFFRKPAKGEFTLPTGTYAVESWLINRKDTKGGEWQLTGSGLPESKKFKVTAGKVANVKMGEPIRGELTARELTNQVSFSMSFLGVAGERVDFMKGNQRPPGPKLQVASTDNLFRSTNNFEFG